MKLILCMDTRNGICFNGRRQSRDSAIIGEIVRITAGETLWIHPSSAKLFDGMDVKVLESKDYLQCAAENDWCFSELDDVTSILPRVHKLYIFRWHCAYPYDISFPQSILNADYNLLESTEFTGHSHPKILLEVYTR